MDEAAPLAEQEIIRRIASGTDRIRILDVGAGPLTVLGKRLTGVQIDITAVDPLAGDYGTLLQRHGIAPPIRTQWCEGERTRWITR